jgi:hypothetical protein
MTINKQKLKNHTFKERSIKELSLKDSNITEQPIKESNIIEIESKQLPSPQNFKNPLPRHRPLIGLPVGEMMFIPTEVTRILAQKADVLEIKSELDPEWLPKDKPRVFHWGYGLVEDDFKRFFPTIRPRLNQALGFSADLGPSATTRQGVLPMSKILSPKAMETIIGQTLDVVRQSYSGALSVENYNYYPTGLYERVCEPDYISRLLEKFDLRLVLDLAHAEVSAHNLKTPLRAYLESMPWERITEIHISRPYIPSQKQALAVDAHWPPQKTQWDLLKWALKKIPLANPLLVVECYQSHQIVAQAYQELESILTTTIRSL